MTDNKAWSELWVSAWNLVIIVMEKAGPCEVDIPFVHITYKNIRSVIIYLIQEDKDFDMWNVYYVVTFSVSTFSSE